MLFCYDLLYHKISHYGNRTLDFELTRFVLIKRVPHHMHIKPLESILLDMVFHTILFLFSLNFKILSHVGLECDFLTFFLPSFRFRPLFIYLLPLFSTSFPLPSLPLSVAVVILRLKLIPTLDWHMHATSSLRLIIFSF